MVHLSTNYNRARQAGLSLVELMVALVLGLLLSAGVITIFISAKQDYQVQDAVSQVQENGRFSLEFLSSDIRMAGYTGCNNEVPIANSVENPPSSLANFGEGIQGFTGTPPTAQFPDALAGTDAIIIHSADTNEEYTVTSHNGSSATISIAGTHEFDVGSILMIVDSDCSSQGLFVMTGPNSGTKNNAVHQTGTTYNIGGSSGVGNCTKALKGNFACSNQSGASSTRYSDGSRLLSMKSVGYYIKDPSQVATISSPTLYRVNFQGNYTTTATVEQPLVEGVSDLEILYGVRSGGNVQYKAADVVEAAGEWRDVIAVRLDLEAQSLTQVDGASIVRNFVRTVRLRNR